MTEYTIAAGQGVKQSGIRHLLAQTAIPHLVIPQNGQLSGNFMVSGTDVGGWFLTSGEAFIGGRYINTSGRPLDSGLTAANVNYVFLDYENVVHYETGKTYRSGFEHMLMIGELEEGTDNYSNYMPYGRMASGYYKEDSIGNRDVMEFGVGSGHLASGTVYYGMLSSGSVSSGKLAPSSINTTDINDYIVSSGKLASGTVYFGMLSSGSVSSGTISPASINTTDITDNAITVTKFDDYTISSGKIASGTINFGMLSSGSVSSGILATNSINTQDVVDESITTSKLASGLQKSLRYYAGLSMDSNLISAKIVMTPTNDRLKVIGYMLPDAENTEYCIAFNDDLTSTNYGTMTQVIQSGSTSMDIRQLGLLGTGAHNREFFFELEVAPDANSKHWKYRGYSVANRYGETNYTHNTLCGEWKIACSQLSIITIFGGNSGTPLMAASSKISIYNYES